MLSVCGMRQKHSSNQTYWSCFGCWCFSLSHRELIYQKGSRINQLLHYHTTCRDTQITSEFRFMETSHTCSCVYWLCIDYAVMNCFCIQICWMETIRIIVQLAIYIESMLICIQRKHWTSQEYLKNKFKFVLTRPWLINIRKDFMRFCIGIVTTLHDRQFL